MKVPKWYQLGLELIDDEIDVNIIKENHKNDTEACLEATFNLWMKRCENPTWEKIVAGLRNIGENNLAAELEEEYCN